MPGVGLALVLAVDFLVRTTVLTSVGGRAQTSGSMRGCLQQRCRTGARNPADTWDPAACHARHQPGRDDTFELVTFAGVKPRLAAAGIAYLTRT